MTRHQYIKVYMYLIEDTIIQVFVIDMIWHNKAFIMMGTRIKKISHKHKKRAGWTSLKIKQKKFFVNKYIR